MPHRMDYIDHLNFAVERGNYEMFQKMVEIYCHRFHSGNHSGIQEYCTYVRFKELAIIDKEDTRFVEFWLRTGRLPDHHRKEVLKAALDRNSPLLADLVLGVGAFLNLPEEYLKERLHEALRYARLDSCDWLIRNMVNFEGIMISIKDLPEISLQWLIDTGIRRNCEPSWFLHHGVIKSYAAYDTLIRRMLELGREISERDFQSIIQSPVDVGEILMRYQEYTKFFRESLGPATMVSFIRHGDHSVIEERIEGFSENARAVTRLYMIAPKKSAISP
jgi:hypothetical protein